MERTELKKLLSAWADELDAPKGPGGGALALSALAEIEALERRLLPPPEPSSS